MTKKMILLIMVSIVLMTGCSENQSNIVEHNLTQEADNFNVARELTVINCIEGEVLFKMSGKISITADVQDDQLEVIVEESDGTYKKHFIGLSDNVTYVIEDITTNDVDKYNYALNFNPEMIWPLDVETID